MLDELKELLGHIDAPTRGEIIRRCANYESEINYLKRQYKQLQDATPKKPSATARDIVTRARSDIKNAIRREGQCTVFYCDSLKRFRVVTQDARIETERTRSELVGIYNKGFDERALSEDLYFALTSLGKQ